MMRNIRNFVIVAHVDHGKSTLADRFLEITETVEKRKMQEQFLDTMELERERGITIKLQPVRMIYKASLKVSEFKSLNSQSNSEYILNLIDTPGHVDFSYEVSRSLAAVEGAILLVDASKGVQAQTLANLHLAQKQGLKIIPVINKIDLPNARTEKIKDEIAYLLGVEPNTVLKISGKLGTNVEKVLEKVVKDVPPPKQDTDYNGQGTDSSGQIKDSQQQSVSSPHESVLKALVFDSTFDAYKGVIAYIRVFEGSVKAGDKILAYATGAKADVLETGYFSPKLVKNDGLSAGDIGYVATGIKDPGVIRVGDTIMLQNYKITDSGLRIEDKKSENTQYAIRNKQFVPLEGYKEPKPMVFTSFFPEDADDYDDFKDALGKLKLTDASLTYEPESSAGLGRGYMLGFLGMLHIEIISERLKREFGLQLIVSTPSVEYTIKLKNGPPTGGEEKIRSASLLPDPSKIESIAEPVVNMEIIVPSQYLGSIMDLVSNYRNVYQTTDYLGQDTVVLKYQMPLAEIVTDFYDKLKSVSSGYASMSYEFSGIQTASLVRLDILIADEMVEPFSRIVPKEKVFREGREIVAKLKEVVPAQWFQVAIQAAIGGKIIARETIKARRKDVTGYLYGGDVTRKKKLLEKQKKGKEKMKERGRVNLSQEVFLKMLKR